MKNLVPEKSRLVNFDMDVRMPYVSIAERDRPVNFDMDARVSYVSVPEGYRPVKLRIMGYIWERNRGFYG